MDERDRRSGGLKNKQEYQKASQKVRDLLDQLRQKVDDPTIVDELDDALVDVETVVEDYIDKLILIIAGI